MNYEPPRNTRRGEQPEIGTPEIRRQIGKELKTAREFHQMSLEQVVAVTRISARYLDDIENGKWSFLTPTYVKAFIICYSEIVGVDSEKLRSQLDDIFPSLWALPEPSPETSDWEEKSTSEARALGTGVMGWAESNRSIIFYTVVAVVIIALVLFYILRPIPSPLPTAAQQTTTLKSQPVPETESEETSEPPADELLATADSTFRLELAARDTCYIKIVSGDSLLYERTVWPGNRLSFEPRRPVNVTLGNAGAVTITVNGDTLPPLTGAERVKSVKIGSKGIIP